MNSKNELSWAQKAQVAVAAREQAKVLRKGKPKSFRNAIGGYKTAGEENAK